MIFYPGATYYSTKSLILNNNGLGSYVRPHTLLTLESEHTHFETGMKMYTFTNEGGYSITINEGSKILKTFKLSFLDDFDNTNIETFDIK